MAITNIEITQDNKVGDSNLMPIHSPLVFIADVTYTGDVPEVLNVEIFDTTGTLATYKAIPYKDPTSSIRQFMFIAGEPVRSLMNSFNDFAQLNETFVFVEDITEVLWIKFVDPNTPATFDNVKVTFIHGVEQFGNNPNLTDQYNNITDTYFAAKDSIVYVYFYNNDNSNLVEVNTPSIIESNALDYDDAIFTDYDDDIFTIDTP